MRALKTGSSLRAIPIMDAVLSFLYLGSGKSYSAFVSICLRSQQASAPSSSICVPLR